MTTRSISFPPEAASAFGSRHRTPTYRDFPSEARSAFSNQSSATTHLTSHTAFDETAARAFGRSGQGSTREFGAEASAAFGMGQGRTESTRGFGAEASAAFGTGQGRGGFDNRASSAFGHKKPTSSSSTSSSAPAIVRGNTMGAHFAALLGDSPTIIGRSGSALFKKKETTPVLTQEEMFPALGAPATATAAATAATATAPATPATATAPATATVQKVVKMSFADLARKRAQEDEEDRVRSEQMEATRRQEQQRLDMDLKRARTIHNIRSTFNHKKTLFVEEEEEFCDEGEAYIRPEDMEESREEAAEEEEVW